jgi:hypothetical protein
MCVARRGVDDALRRAWRVQRGTGAVNAAGTGRGHSGERWRGWSGAHTAQARDNSPGDTCGTLNPDRISAMDRRQRCAAALTAPTPDARVACLRVTVVPPPPAHVMRARSRPLPLIAFTLASLSAPLRAQDSMVTLSSGTFEQLILVADADAKVLSGYYRSARGGRHCRLYLRGPLVRASLGQRNDVGEAYSVEAWDPVHPGVPMTAEIFSIAREGFRQQLILSISSGLSSACRAADSFDRGYGASLNRYDWVSNSFVGVRVVRASRMRVYELEKRDGVLRRVRLRVRAPHRYDGVWVDKTYSPEYSPRGMLRIAWDDGGTPHGGYVHERDLYPGRLAASEEPR